MWPRPHTKAQGWPKGKIGPRCWTQRRSSLFASVLQAVLRTALGRQRLRRVRVSLTLLSRGEYLTCLLGLLKAPSINGLAEPFSPCIKCSRPLPLTKALKPNIKIYFPRWTLCRQRKCYRLSQAIACILCMLHLGQPEYSGGHSCRSK